MKMSDKKFKFAEIISTFFGIGNIRWCPGTFGSLATFPLFFLINYLFLRFGISCLTYLFIGYMVVLGIIIYLAFWSIDIYITTNKKDDPSEVVIDEVVGQMISYMMSMLLMGYYAVYVLDGLVFNQLISVISSFIIIVCPFLFFRVFDILKPGMVGYCDTKMKGAKGVIMDDVIAGIYSGLVVCLMLSALFLGVGCTY